MTKTKNVPHSLVLISTPSQAFFLSQTPEVSGNAVLILTIKSSDEADRILTYVKGLDWDEIIIWYIPYAEDKLVYYKLFRLRLKVIYLKLKYPSFSRIYFGSYANIIHLSILAEFEPKTKLILLYDGLQLVSVNHFRNRLSEENKKTYPRIYKLLGFKEPKIAQLTYISPLKLNTEGGDHIEVIKRKKKTKSQQIQKDLIFYIGQPLPQVGMISSEYYINTLKKLKLKYSKKIIYFPHPREDEKLVREIGEFFEIKVPETIFEEYYMQLENVPAEVISLYSSVLVNLIFLGAESKISAIEIPEKEINGERFRKLNAPVYEYFHQISSKGFQVLKSDNL